MKIFATILVLLISTLNGVIAQNEVIKSIKLEVIKPLTWVANGGYVLEPEFSIHHKNISYNLSLGINNIKTLRLNNQYDYSNKGQYGQISVLVRIGSGENTISGVYMGVGGNIARYEESGIVTFTGNHFEDYRIRVAQKNTTFGVNWLTSTKFNINDRFYSDFTFRIAQVLNELKEPVHPVYYVPGMGLIISPENRNTFGMSIGFSIKVGYIL